MKQEITVNDVKDELEKLLGRASGARGSITAEFGKVQEKRIARLEKAQARLKEALGADHPRVIALGRAASQAVERKGAFEDTSKREAKREARRREIKPNEWVVWGRVLNAVGEPVPNLCVQAFDEDRWSRNDPLGHDETDEFGDFFIVYDQDKFSKPLKEERPDLYLKIVDAKGEPVYPSQDQIRRNASRSEYFEIQVSL
jgi:hypothetical protein